MYAARRDTADDRHRGGPGGQMPRLVDGRQQKGDPYVTGGFSLTLGFGAR